MPYLLGFSWDSNLACFFLLDAFVLVYFYLPCYVLFFRKHKCCWQQVWEPRRVEISVEACGQQVSVFGAGGFPWPMWPSQVEIHARMARTFPVDHSAWGIFPTLVFFLCRDQDGSKKPADISQVGAGSPAHKEPKPSPVAVPPAKQDSGMKDKSFAFILLIRKGTGIVLQGCVGGECAFAFRIFALCTCFSLVVPLFCAFGGWPPILPQGEGLSIHRVPFSARQPERFLSCIQESCLLTLLYNTEKS